MREDDTPGYERETFLKNRLDALVRLLVGKFYDKNAPGYRRNDSNARFADDFLNCGVLVSLRLKKFTSSSKDFIVPDIRVFELSCHRFHPIIF